MKPPEHLSQEAANLWRALAEEYQIEDAAGLALLTLVGEALDRMRSAQRLISEHGELIATGEGSWKANPAVGIEKDARAHMMQAIKQLHLDVEPIKSIGRPPLSVGG